MFSTWTYQKTESNVIHSNTPPVHQCYDLNVNNENILSFEKTLKLTLCVKLFQQFGCQGDSQFYKPISYGNDQLRFASSYRKCNEEEKARYNERVLVRGKKHSLRKRRDVETNTTYEPGINPTNVYIMKLSNRSIEYLEKKIKKYEYKFFHRYFKEMVPHLLENFTSFAPSWETDLRNLNWTEFLTLGIPPNTNFSTYQLFLMELNLFFRTYLRSNNPYHAKLDEKLLAMYYVSTEVMCHREAKNVKLKKQVQTLEYNDEFETSIWGIIQEEIYNRANAYGVEIKMYKMTLYPRTLI